MNSMYRVNVILYYSSDTQFAFIILVGGLQRHFSMEVITHTIKCLWVAILRIHYTYLVRPIPDIPA